MSWNTFTAEEWDNFTPDQWDNFIVNDVSVDWLTFTPDQWNNFTPDNWNNFFADAPFGGRMVGTHNVFNVFEANAVMLGRYLIFNQIANNRMIGKWELDLFANSRMFGTYSVAESFNNNRAFGQYGITLAFENNRLVGQYGIALSFSSNRMLGTYGIAELFIDNQILGQYGVSGQFGGRFINFYRIANDLLDRFELYRGIGAEPDFDAAPFDTSVSLPFTTAALSFPTENFFVLRKRNRFNLLSQNIASFRLNLDASGNVIADPPSPPLEIAISPATGGAVFVIASYFYLLDKDLQGNQFLVFIRSDGTDPDPINDTPDIVNMIKSDGVAELSFTSPTFADGLTIKALVQIRRTDPGPVLVDSVNLVPVTTLSDISGPALPFPSAIFFGKAASQGGIGG